MIMNIAEQVPVIKEDDTLKEKMFLAKNLVQDYFAKLDYRNCHPDEEEVPEEEEADILKVYGEEFEMWYKSQTGKRALLKYAEKHSGTDIIAEKDMDELVQSFFVFRNRQLL